MAHYQADADHRGLFLAAIVADQRFFELDALVSRCLQVPRSFAGVWRIAARIRDLLPHWRALDPDWAFPDTVEEWVRRVSAIPIDSPFRSIPILDSPATRALYASGPGYESQVFKGILETNAVWVSMWYRYRGAGFDENSKPLADAYDRLVALFTASYAKLAERGEKPQVELRPYQASVTLFKLHGAEYRPSFDRWRARAADVGEQYECFRGEHKLGAEDLRQGYGALADLVNQGFELPYLSVFRQRSRSVRWLEPIRPGLDIQDDGERDFWVLQTDAGDNEFLGLSPVHKEVKGPGKALEKEIVASGLNPLEFADEVLAWVATEDLLDPKKEESSSSDGDLAPLGALFAAARGRQRAENMSAQLFTTRLSRTRPPELARIINALNAMYRDGADSAWKWAAVSHPQVQETIRFLAVMIVTGAKAEDVKDLCCYKSAEELPDGWKLAYSPKHSVWLHPYLPPQRKPLAFQYREASVETWPRIARSDIWSIGQTLGRPDYGRWFPKSVQFYERIFRETIAPKLPSTGFGQRLRSMQDFRDMAYAWCLGMDEGDQLRVSVLFDRNAATCETQHWYTAFDRAALDEFYVSRMSELWRRMEDAGLDRGGSLFHCGSASNIPDTLTGNDYVPRISSIINLVTELKAKLRPPKVNELDVIEQHNIKTAYVALGMALVTGFRAIRTPIPDLTLIDPSTGFMSLQEKDRADLAHARLVWIPELLREQVKRYLVHLSTMSFELSPAEGTRYTAKATKRRDRSRFNGDTYEISLLRTFYFASEDKNGWLKASELTGEALMAVLNEVAPNHWPVANAHRHFLRTYLVEAGCPAVLINTLLGHWHVGEAYWGPDSAMDPYSFRIGIATDLERLLADIGYELIDL